MQNHQQKVTGITLLKALAALTAGASLLLTVPAFVAAVPGSSPPSGNVAATFDSVTVGSSQTLNIANNGDIANTSVGANPVKVVDPDGFYSLGTTSAGVSGLATNIGVYGTASSPSNGTGGIFIGPATGVLGDASSGSSGIGVAGIGKGPKAGVQGMNTDNNGNAMGIEGIATSGYGGKFSGGPWGVFAQSTTGTGGQFSGDTYGIYSTASNGAGGSFSGTNLGISASSSVPGSGIGGTFNGNWEGVIGNATDAFSNGGVFTGGQYGVVGQTDQASGIGGHFRSDLLINTVDLGTPTHAIDAKGNIETTGKVTAANGIGTYAHSWAVAFTPITAGSTGTSSVTCPAGQVAVSCDFQKASSSSPLNIWKIEPTSTTTCTVSAQNGAGSTYSIKAGVTCFDPAN